MVKFPTRSNSQKAQELAYDAMEFMYHDAEKVVKLCEEALKIYPDCVDAQTMLAEIQTELVIDFIEAMEKAVASGRKELGEKCFEEDKGYFWGLLETRPFMRAMMQLAGGYRQMGKRHFDKTIEIFEEMLELNPNDNQGVRYILIDCYLTKKLYQKGSHLLELNKDDSMAVFNWARVLYAYATEGKAAAEKALEPAMEQNEYVLLYLSGKKRQPRYLPECYSPGDETEAIFCADTLKESWRSHREAKRWLKEKI